MKLYAPDGSEIVSILLADGSFSDFKFDASIKNGETTVMYVLPKGRLSKVAVKNGEKMLIDVNGKYWPASDIEYNNAASFERR